MSDLKVRYTTLLLQQVEHEIRFLLDRGHHLKEIEDPCLFCIPDHMGKYRCKRVEELWKFKEQISGNRRRIGYEVPASRFEAPQIPEELTIKRHLKEEIYPAPRLDELHEVFSLKFSK